MDSYGCDDDHLPDPLQLRGLLGAAQPEGGADELSALPARHHGGQPRRVLRLGGA